jgi:hypothetical protein
MDYGSLIRRSWYLTWDYRFLWVLGLFATSTVGSCSPTSAGNGFQWRPDSFDATSLYTPELGQALQQVDPFLSRNIALFFIGVVALVLLAALAFFIVSIIAQGGMAEATASLALGRPTRAGDAWGAGLRMFWRASGLWLA